MANDDDLFAEDLEEAPLEDAAFEDAAPADPLADEAPAPAQQPLAPTQPRTQKPRSNVYTMMLILSLAAIICSCVVLYLYLDQFGEYPWWETPSNISTEVGT